MTRINLSLMLLSLATLFFACSPAPTTAEVKVDPSTELTPVPSIEEEPTATIAVSDELEKEETTASTPKTARQPIAQKPTPRPKTTITTPKKSTSTSTKPAPISEGPKLSTAPKSQSAPPKATTVSSPPPRPKTVDVPATPKKPMLSHDEWDAILGKYVSSAGKVNYASLKANKELLNSYLQVLTDNPPQSDWGRSKSIAYWINVYNAFTVKLIVDNYPVKSIMDLDGGNPWAKKWVKIGNKTLSLNEIEKDYLIKAFKEPRVHFAVNCAAKSCPPLLNRAWTAGNLEANFERQTKNFINNDNYNSISAKSAQLSKIFEWYAADFGNVINFLNKYANEQLSEKTKITYKEYDWGLNQ